MIFQFEQDFVGSLRCIPMSVRLKLDQCGIKLKLHQWLQFSHTQRQGLIDQPAETAEERAVYHHHLVNLIEHVCQEHASELAIDSAPAWENATTIPTSVLEQAATKDIVVTVDLWQNLTPLQRFALIKLSRSSHENSNFVPALKEFSPS